MKIRSATVNDAEKVLSIYSPIVQETAISFELTVPAVDEMRRRIQSALKTHAWLVAEINGELAGYAYGSAHRPRQAYQFSVEVSAYVGAHYHRQGVARALYQALFEALRRQQYHCAFAGIALPNDPSIALHRSMGFARIGVFRDVGFKFDRWHDVDWWQLKL